MIDKIERTPIRVEHVRIKCSRPFEDVLQALKAGAPPLDPTLVEDLKHGRQGAIADHRAHGPKLWLFHSRDHGALIAAEGRSEKAIQFDIGNPLTAESMTRHHLGAALYAPLRIVLYETQEGQAVLEYDLPSSFFGQFGDPSVTSIGGELNRQLEELLLAAAG